MENKRGYSIDNLFFILFIRALSLIVPSIEKVRPKLLRNAIERKGRSLVALGANKLVNDFFGFTTPIN